MKKRGGTVTCRSRKPKASRSLAASSLSRLASSSSFFSSPPRLPPPPLPPARACSVGLNVHSLASSYNVYLKQEARTVRVTSIQPAQTFSTSHLNVGSRRFSRSEGSLRQPAATSRSVVARIAASRLCPPFPLDPFPSAAKSTHHNNRRPNQIKTHAPPIRA